MECPSCGSRDIEFIESSGHRVCVECGTVLEENAIVSSVEFQECGDRSHVVGQFVSASSSKSYGSSSRGHSRYGFSRESRDATLSNAKRVIAQVSSSMRLPPYFTEHAHRLYALALDNKFVYGRRQMHIVATVLYIICRQEKSPHLLIDFSDALQVNIYTIGKTFLQLCRILNLKMPVVDPCLYIHRFVTRLDLGERMGSVSTTALRIVTRMKKDWINTGRRPDGVCSAAILIACRSYGIAKSIAEIAGLFRITEATLKRRLEDFKNTPSSQLTVEQFHQHDFNFELDPPTFLLAKQLDAGRKDELLAFNISGNRGGVVGADDHVDDISLNVTVDAEGNRSQMLKIGDVEIFAQLPGVIYEDDEENAMKSFSLKKQAKTRRRKELYGQIYSEIGEAVEQQLLESENVSKDSSTTASMPTNHLKEQADMLFKEAQEVGQRSDRVGGWNTLKSKSKGGLVYVPYQPRPVKTSNDTAKYEVTAVAVGAAAAVADRSGGAITGKKRSGSYDEEENDDDDYDDEYEERENTETLSLKIINGVAAGENANHRDGTNDDFVMSDSELESFILTDEERIKRTALWEKMHRPFLDEQNRKRQARVTTTGTTTKQHGRSGSHKHNTSGGISGGAVKEGKFSFGDGAGIWSSATAGSLENSKLDIGEFRKSSRNINYGAMSSVEDITGRGSIVDAGAESGGGGGGAGGGGGGSQSRKIIIGASVRLGVPAVRPRGTPVAPGSASSGGGGRSVSFRPTATTRDVTASADAATITTSAASAPTTTTIKTTGPNIAKAATALPTKAVGTAHDRGADMNDLVSTILTETGGGGGGGDGGGDGGDEVFDEDEEDEEDDEDMGGGHDEEYEGDEDYGY